MSDEERNLSNSDDVENLVGVEGVNKQADSQEPAEVVPCPSDRHGKPAWDAEQSDETFTPTFDGSDEDFSGARYDEPVQQPKTKKRFERMFNVALIVVICVLIVLNLGKIFVLSQVSIEQNSMQPTFDPGSSVLINKLAAPNTSDIVVVYKYDVDSKLKAYFAGAKDKGQSGKYALLIKRAVAVGGNEIWSEEADGKYMLFVRVDGKTYQEYYYWDNTQQNVPFAERESGHYFLAENLEQARQLHGETATQITMANAGWIAQGGYTSENPYKLKDDEMLLLGDNRDASVDSRQSGVSYLRRLLGVVISPVK